MRLTRDLALRSPGGRSGGLKSASLSCIVALHWQSPLVELALHSVEDLAQVEQIMEPGEEIRRGAVIRADGILEAVVPLPISPFCRNE